MQRLREDDHDEATLKQTRLDASLGRMTEAYPCDGVWTDRLCIVRLSQRFGVEQGLKDDRSKEIQCVDSKGPDLCFGGCRSIMGILTISISMQAPTPAPTPKPTPVTRIAYILV